MIILSVPHSGTRTLRKYLHNTKYQHFGLGAERYAGEFGKAHIPIRDPLAITQSWAARYGGDESKHQQELLRLLDLMIDYAASHDVMLHRIEDIDIHEGKGPDRKDDPDRVLALREWMPGRLDFYSKFYDLRWL